MRDPLPGHSVGSGMGVGGSTFVRHGRRLPYSSTRPRTLEGRDDPGGEVLRGRDSGQGLFSVTFLYLPLECRATWTEGPSTLWCGTAGPGLGCTGPRRSDVLCTSLLDLRRCPSMLGAGGRVDGGRLREAGD